MNNITRWERYIVLFSLGILLLGSGWNYCQGDDLAAEETGQAWAAQDFAKKVNINLAREEELRALPGVGPVLARRIIEHREKNGYFKTVEEIRNVKGIGEKKLERMKEFLAVE